MAAPHNWLRAAIEQAASVTAWPVENTAAPGQAGYIPPYVVFSRENTAIEQSLDDSIETDTVDSVAKFTVVVYADSYVQVWQIAGLISVAIHKFSGTAYGEAIGYCLVLDKRDGDTGYVDGSEQPTYTVEIAVEIGFQE